jgi:hypothetical protein
VSGEAAVRRMAAAAVLLVAAIAAVISYVHIERLAVTHGQTALAAYLLPLSIDGTVAAASLAMLRAARSGLGTPHLARFMLGLAVAATLASNVAYGARFGITGSLLSGWPAVAFIGSAELAIGMARRAREVSHPPVTNSPRGGQFVTPECDAPEDVPAVSGLHLNGSGLHPDEAGPFAGELSRGEVPTLRRIRAELHVGQPKAQEIQGRLSALARTP